jgi:hypothetical protein
LKCGTFYSHATLLFASHETAVAWSELCGQHEGVSVTQGASKQASDPERAPISIRERRSGLTIESNKSSGLRQAAPVLNGSA